MTLQNSTAGFDEPVQASTNGTGDLAQNETATPSAEAEPVTSQEQQPTMESLQQQIQQMRDDLEKGTRDYSALNGRYKRAMEEKSSTDEIADSIAALTGTVNALIKHQATNDEQVLAEELEKVQADTANRSTSRSFTNASAEMVREITDTVEELGLNLETSEELADFRSLWTPAYQNNDTSGLYAAYAEFLKVARRLERSKRETAVEETKRTADEERRKQNEELGINDLDSGVGMPVSPNGNSLLTRLGNSETSVTRDEIAQAAEQMQKLGIRF